MADPVDQVNTNDVMLWANTFSVKEEQREEDSFVENKVYISETAITTDNDELQGPIWHGKIKQHEEFTSLDNIKTEFASCDGTEGQSDVKVEEGVSADYIKSEFDNGVLYCETCEAYYEGYCIECGMLVHILNENVLNSADNGAGADIPNYILEIQDCFGQTGIYALRIIPAGVKFGPFTGLSGTECPWEMEGEKFVLCKSKSKCFNWMKYIKPTSNTTERNLLVFQCEDNIYYESTRPIQACEELLVYFDVKYGNNPDFAATMKDISKDVYACTFCCLGFSSKSHLAKHKTFCVKDATGKFSIEELTQCQFCKIHLDLKEYLEHHMTFCCDRNARKCILPTPMTKQAIAALDGGKRCLRQVDLEEHTNNKHFKVKIYKCGICNRRLKTKESLSLHMENTHVYVGGKDDKEHSAIDYRNTHIRVKRSSSQDKKLFKCSLCVFRAKYKQSLNRHMKTIHLKQFDLKCDECEFRTTCKSNLEKHIKATHLKEFDYKCNFCEFATNRKYHLKIHVKTKHLKIFDFKCDSCEFETNIKSHLTTHIKNNHLKRFDYKCDSCEYRTNNNDDLKKHTKTKHLKEFDYKCDSCEIRTNDKRKLEAHIKTKHLKRFDYKCDSCEFGTNDKNHLKIHIKTKHLKRLDYKCDSCEFGTNIKSHLKRHIKTKHLKQLYDKCEFCEYASNGRKILMPHIKTKHCKKFDFKCSYCEFRTDRKEHLEVHIKTNHLKEFEYRCDSCEFGTNNKNHLETHVKTKHLKVFDLKCDKCEFETNFVTLLKRHIKTNHLKEFDYI